MPLLGPERTQVLAHEPGEHWQAQRRKSDEKENNEKEKKKNAASFGIGVASRLLADFKRVAR